MNKLDSRKLFAIVPMKAHSERVINKNIRKFNEKPLFYWIFYTLSQVSQVSKLILDTDSEKIAELVRSYVDVDVVFRPQSLRGDFVSMNCIIEHVISLYPEQPYFLQTHSTNPLLKKEIVENSIKTFFELKEYDSLFSVNKYQSRFYDYNFCPVNHDPKVLKRTQDLPSLYEENSNIYLFSHDSFQTTRARIGKRPYLFEMDPIEAIDIDTEEDFKMAEILWDKLYGQ